MIYGSEWLDHLTRHDPIWRPREFDRVTVCGRFNDEPPAASRPLFSLLAPCYSEFESGPNLSHVAEVAGYITGRPGWFGLHSCRPLGWKAVD